MRSPVSLVRWAAVLLATMHGTACGPPTTEATLAGESLRGIIVARAPLLPDGESAVWSRPMMLVDGTAFREAEEPCQAQWWFTISGTTEVWQGAARADTSQLTIGREVEVWAKEDWLLPCPAIGSATHIKLK